MQQETDSIRKIILKEMYGLGDLVNNRPTPNVSADDPLTSNYNRDQYSYKIQDEQKARKDKDYADRYVNPSNPLNRFQIEAKQRLLDKQDTFLSIPPSRGKTDPIIGGFRILLKRYLLKKSNINYIPTLLYIVPRKQLAGQITSKDVYDDIIIPLIFPIMTLPEEKQENLDTSHLFTGFDKDNRNEVIKFGMRLAESLTAEITGGGNSNVNFINLTNSYLNFPFKPIIVSTYEPAIKYLNNKISHIVIDEVQELVPHPGDNFLSADLYDKSGTEKLGRYQSLTSVLKNAPINSSITLMTGSVNDASVRNIATYFNRQYSRNFKVVPDFDASLGPALNRSTISVQPLQSMSGGNAGAINNRISLSKRIIIENQNNSLMIIFSKSQKGQGIFRIIQEVIKSLPPKNESFMRDLLPTHKTIKSYEGINLVDVKPDQLNRSINEFEYLKYFNIQDMFQSGSSSKNTATTPDENNILYQGMLRGIAPLIGSMDQYHKKTLQKLFIANKIQLLLATDALGVGANVKCRYFYIPSASKFDGSRLSKVDESSLTQLIHRAGRGNFDIATVYCSIEDFEYISRLVFNDPRSTISQINPYLLQDLQDLEQKHGSSFIKKLLSRVLFKR